jgi:hypothetical protein
MRVGAELGRVRLQHLVAHKGWSFPARVVCPAAPLSGTPARQVAEARARGYFEDCAAKPGPRTWCDRLGRVVPDPSGSFEPEMIGVLVGPDAELGEHLPVSEAPRHLLDAIVVAEDRNFREHSGVNFHALVRALVVNAKEGGYAQGGSTWPCKWSAT